MENKRKIIMLVGVALFATPLIICDSNAQLFVRVICMMVCWAGGAMVLIAIENFLKNNKK